MKDLIKTIQSTQDIAALAKITTALAPPVFVTSLTRMIEDVERQQRSMLEALTKPLLVDFSAFERSLLGRITRDIAGLNAVQQDFLRLQTSVFAKNVSARMFETPVIKASIPAISQATAAWRVAITQLTNQIKGIEQFAQSEVNAVPMFQFSRVYTDFFQHTVDQLACSPSLEVASRLRGSLHLAQFQLLQVTATVNDFGEIQMGKLQPSVKTHLAESGTRQKAARMHRVHRRPRTRPPH